MRKFIIWFFGVAIALVIAAIAAYLLAKRFEEPVRNYVIKEVNKRLQSPVHVADINFSLLENFPSASLVMDSVWARENIVKIGEQDTLFFFEKVYLNLNPFDMLKGQYKINEIEVRDGFLDLYIDDEGFDNYHIWVKSQDTTGFLLELDRVHIERTDITYINKARDQAYLLTADDLYFNGRFSDESYTMAVAGTGFVQDIRIKGTSYLSDRDVEVETDLDIITAEDRYAFRKGRLVIDDRLAFSVAGEWVGEGVDLHIKGSELDVIRTLSLIPNESRAALDDYTSTGFITFDCTLRGAFGKTENPRLKATFSLHDATISKASAKWVLTGLEGRGSIDNGSSRNFHTAFLDFDTLRGLLNEDPFEASFSVLNFHKPALEGRVSLTSDIASLNEFFEFAWLEEGSGRIAMKANIKTVLTDLSQPTASDFLNAEASGSASIEDAEIKLKDDERAYSIREAEFTIVDEALKIDRYEGAINDCSVSLQGVARGFLGYVFSDDGIVDIVGKVKTGTIDLEELFPSRSESQSGIVVAFPQRTEWNVEVETESFKQGKFVADDVKGRLVMNHFKIEAHGLSFKSQQGKVTGKVGVYRFANNQFGLRTDFTTAAVDITELFSTFNNFEQDFITSKELRGRLDADIQFQAFCDSLLNIDMQSIVSSLDLKISEGAIVGFQPLIDVASEIRKRPMMRLFVAVDELEKRLRDVRFATLQNHLSIRDGVVSIPSMQIRSSAIDMNVSGTHTFDDRIDYSMDFALSEVLQLKDRTEPYNEFVNRDDQGKTRIFMTMKGTVDDFEVELERTTLKQTVKEQVQEETTTVKRLLKDEFNALAKDSVRRQPPRKEELQINFDPESGSSWRESEVKEVQGVTDKAKGEKEKKGLFKGLMEKTETDKKKLKEGDFKDDDF